jgi:nucleotide-binding universal stress UspA family protein
MTKTIVLAVDVASDLPARNVAAAVEVTRELAHDTGDRVVVLHVHEFAVGRFGRIQVDCHDGDGEKLVADIVADLKKSGVDTEGAVRDAAYGHLASGILTVVDEYDPRVLVLGARSRTDLPLLPFGSVSHRLLHLAKRPVLIVPRHADTAGASAAPEAETADVTATA